MNTPYPESIDYIGLILFQAAALASEQKEVSVKHLLQQYLNT